MRTEQKSPLFFFQLRGTIFYRGSTESRGSRRAHFFFFLFYGAASVAATGPFFAEKKSRLTRSGRRGSVRPSLPPSFLRLFFARSRWRDGRKRRGKRRRRRNRRRRRRRMGVVAPPPPPFPPRASLLSQAEEEEGERGEREEKKR